MYLYQGLVDYGGMSGVLPHAQSSAAQAGVGDTFGRGWQNGRAPSVTSMARLQLSVVRAFAGSPPRCATLRIAALQ